MPTVFTEGGYRFFFYSNEHRPIHVHVRKVIDQIDGALGLTGDLLAGGDVLRADDPIRVDDLMTAAEQVVRPAVEDAVGLTRDLFEQRNLRRHMKDVDVIWRPEEPGAQAQEADRIQGLEARQAAVVRRHLPLALDHVHVDGRLAVDCRAEDLPGIGRNGAVPRDQLLNHAAVRLDPQR